MGSLVKRDPDLLLCIFIHGFKGDDNSFGGFPHRLQHILEQTLTNVTIECIVFPAYETKGELTQAVHRFVDWLTTLVVEKEVAKGLGGGAGKAKVILCSHSMGGLLAADATLALASSRSDDSAPLWPNIVGCIAFDTPYLGLHPWVFKNSISQAAEYAQAIKNVSTIFSMFGGKSTPASASTKEKAPPLAIPAPPAPPLSSSADSATVWSRLLNPTVGYAAGGVLLASAAVGAAYYRREDISSSVNWAQDHLKYVGTLWNEKEMQDRLVAIIKLSRPKSEGGQNVVFRNFYTFLPPGKDFPQPRTFVILPQPKPESTLNPAAYFHPAQNSEAEDEVHAHTGMFQAASNDGYYQLGLDVVEIIIKALGHSPLSEDEAGNVVELASQMENDGAPGRPANPAPSASPANVPIKP